MRIMDMDRALNTWVGDWRAKIRSRLGGLSSETIADLLAKNPGKSYLATAALLGEDVAAIQIEQLQFEEARTPSEFRMAAIDSFVRECNYHLPSGWPEVSQGNFDIASVYADWITRIKLNRPEFGEKANSVWEKLKSLHPPAGWLPLDTSDEIVQSAFSVGWII